MKLYVIAALGLSQALAADDTDMTDPEKYEWKPKYVQVKYDQVSLDASVCAKEGDGASCAPDHYCMRHMWGRNYEIDSGLGCWHKSVCKPGANSFVLKANESWKL